MQTFSLNAEELIPILQEQLQSGGAARLGVTGTSMMPLLRNGKDSVLLCPADAPKKGDILLYRRKNGHYVLHRVVGLGETTLLCCGDNQWAKEPVLPEQALAKVCAYYRGDKKHPVSGFCYWCYVNHLPLRRLCLRLISWLYKCKNLP